MLRDEFEAPGQQAPDDLRVAYERVLAETVETVGVDEVAAESGVDHETLTALVDGESPELTLEAAAAILSTDPDRPDADFIEADARDILMMGMSIAVLDVDALESGIDGRMEAKEIQQKMEGRFPMTVGEYAVLHQHIESATR